MGDFLTRLECAEVDGASYTCRIDSEGRACIAHCKAALSCLRIPDHICGCPVTSIGESAFAKLSHVEDIVCPHSLEHIAAHAFEGCHRLRSITLNSGLRSIGEEAFFLCTALEDIDVPATVESFGPRPLGASVSRSMHSKFPFELRLAPESERLFHDADGILYERREDGSLLLVDGYRFQGATLTCNPRTVEIGARSLSQMPNLKRVVLPRGLKRIGDEAFRGDTNLEHIDLPETLEHIGKAAFSCTSLKALRIPAACTDVDDSAFALGPIAADGSIRPYRSTLQTLDVDPENKVFHMVGDVLNKRTANNGLEALLAPSHLERVEFDSRISRVHATAIAGVTSIDTLSLADGAEIDHMGALLAACECKRIEIAFAGDSGFRHSFTLPKGPAGKTLLAKGLCAETFSAADFMQLYDEALGAIEDGLEQARLVVDRLASPAFIDKAAERDFRAFVNAQLPAICSAFGERAEFELLERLADCGVLDEQTIPDIADMLSGRGDAQTIGYLLDMKRRRFGKSSWSDYDI